VSDSFHEIAWYSRFFSGNGSFQWYRSLFLHASRRGKITGEVTPAYAMLSIPTIRALQELNSRMKIVYLLRNPMDRAWSHAVKDLLRRRNRNISQVPEETFRRFFEEESCMKRSDYVNTLANWNRVFPRRQIFVGFYDDILNDPRKLLGELFTFLEISTDEVEDISSVYDRANPAAFNIDDIPAGLSRFLAEQYEPLLRTMREMFGGYASEWHEQAVQRLRGNNV